LKNIKPIILCGGSGTRLWPLSRQSLPKQFTSLIDDKSLLEMTFRRVEGLVSNQSIQVLANIDHQFLVKDHAKLAGVEVEMVLESSAKNTAPAILAAALLANEDELLLFLPADHYIPDRELFIKTIEKGIVSALNGSIVTYGIRPTSAHTGYGYIECEDNISPLRVNQFIEKPNEESAQNYINLGNYYWSAGIFLVTAKTIIDGMKKHAKDIFDTVNLSVKGAKKSKDSIYLNKDSFDKTRSESIDYALLEKSENIIMVPFSGEWSDVGGWNALADLDVTLSKNTHQYDSVNTYIKSDKRPVIAIGMKDTIIVDTSDAVLVASKDHAEKVKEVVADLSKKDIKESKDHNYSYRPWGVFESIEEGLGYKVKNLTINSGESLSLQRHQHRSEHWVVVEGTAEVTCGDETFTLQQNESTYIPKGEIHKLSNPSNEILKIIEIQTGDYLKEDDIERLDDRYGRA